MYMYCKNVHPLWALFKVLSVVHNQIQSTLLIEKMAKINDVPYHAFTATLPWQRTHTHYTHYRGR